MKTKRFLKLFFEVCIIAIVLYIATSVNIGYYVRNTLYNNCGTTVYTYNDNPLINQQVAKLLDPSLRHKHCIDENMEYFYDVSFPIVFHFGTNAICTYTYTYYAYSLTEHGRELVYGAHNVNTTIEICYKNGKWQFVNVKEKI